MSNMIAPEARSASPPCPTRCERALIERGIEHRGGSSRITDMVAELLTGYPFIGCAHLERCFGHMPIEPDYIVAIPARNERMLLPSAVRALVHSMRRSQRTGALVFVVNNTTDRSADIITTILDQTDHPYVVAQVDFERSIRNAPHARRLALDIGLKLAPHGHLLTTDADSRVGLRWIETIFDAFGSGYDFVCEDVQLDEAELSELPPLVRRVGDVERAYFEASERLWQLWTKGRALPLAYRASGASLAVTASAYRAIGGLPLPPKGEDGALCDRVLEHGYRALQLANIGTRTSARLNSRARGGCGETLARRAAMDNPECDANLVPLDILRERVRAVNDDPTARFDPVEPPMQYRQVERELRAARHLLGEGP